MSSQAKRHYTLEEYFELERQSEVKYEYWNGEVYAMSGASLAHEQILSNVIFHLRDQLRGRPCRVFPSNTRLKVPTMPPYRYPDLMVLCDKVEAEVIGGLEVLVNPTMIVEILSPSTEAYDRGDKFMHYKSILSFGEYLLIAQHRPHVTHYVKRSDNSWSYEDANEITAALSLPTIDCALSLREVYQDVAFEPMERLMLPLER